MTTYLFTTAPTNDLGLLTRARVAAAGAGIMIPVSTVTRKKYVDTAALSAAVRTVLSQECFASRAREISRQLRSYGGAARAAELILDFSEKLSR